MIKVDKIRKGKKHSGIKSLNVANNSYEGIFSIKE